MCLRHLIATARLAASLAGIGWVAGCTPYPEFCFMLAGLVLYWNGLCRLTQAILEARRAQLDIVAAVYDRRVLLSEKPAVIDRGYSRI